MSKNYYRRSTCRQCNSNNLTKAINLKPTPTANGFIRKSQLSNDQDLYPLDVYFCNNCTHLQLLDVIDPNFLYKNYIYVSGTSPVFIKHFQEYFEYIKGNYFEHGLIIDIGSNDGTLLKFFKDSGYDVIGVDPAKKIADEALENGIPSLIQFFSNNLAEEILEKYGPASVITANNVFAHIDNPVDVLKGVKTLIQKSGGIFVFEVSYLLDVIKDNLFDTIYHEHLDYHSIISLDKFLTLQGFEIIRIDHLNTHGGSIRVTAQLIGGRFKTSNSIIDFIKQEKEFGLDKLNTYINFSEEIKSIGKEIHDLLSLLKSKNKVIAGYGAPAKSTTLLHHFGIGPDTVSYIIDDSKWKQNLYTPGTHIPIFSKDHLLENRADYILILAWNFAKSIMENNANFKNNGGRFIVPLPKIEIF